MYGSDFGITTSFPSYDRQGWQTIINNLSLHAGQQAYGILKTPKSIVLSLHKALEKAHKQKKR